RDVLFGFSQSHQIYSMIGIHLWTAMPYATLSYMIVRQSKKSFRVDENGLVYCLHKCFEYGETFGIKAYYSLQKYRGIRHKRRSWRQYDTPLTSRYYSLLEYRVEAHHRPQHSIIYELMDKRTWPHPVGIWCTRLKPKYENLINWGD
ncbi:MAG: hypothetical protein KDD35_06385, partial [Bdellovibrionales bacterium]|nr:hypothetical protein [Bdellovibrionales bacterium]